MGLHELVEFRGRYLAFDAVPPICRLAYLHHHPSNHSEALEMYSRCGARTWGRARCNDSKRLYSPFLATHCILSEDLTVTA